MSEVSEVIGVSLMRVCRQSLQDAWRRRAAATLPVAVLGLLMTPGAALAKFFPEGGQDAPAGVTISGTGFARVDAPNRLSEDSIERAVEAAKPRAASRAVRDARARAAAIADTLGVELGPLSRLELEDTPGQFGQGRRYCRRPRPNRQRRCQAPSFTATAATVTFSIVDGAQASSGPEVSAPGAASVPTEPENPRGNRSIRLALGAARIAATPKAAVAARQSAETAARAAGLTLGAIVSISEPQQPYPYFYDPTLGSFGAGQFCGVVRRVRARRDPETGRRRIIRRTIGRRCRFPRTLTLRLEATYEAR